MTNPSYKTPELQHNRGKIAICVQRYGEEIIGGAEAHARIVAEKLALERGYEVDVYTTTAKDYMTWGNFFPAGETRLSGVKVRRFNSLFPRCPQFGFLDRVVRRGIRALNKWPIGANLKFKATEVLEWIWILLQGPFCPDLVKSLIKDSQNYKKIIFFCYLYYPTLAGMSKLKDRSILIPLAHDEPPFYFRIVQKMIRDARWLIFNAEPERDRALANLSLLTNDSQIYTAKQALPALGFDFAQSLEQPSPVSTGSNQEKFLLYLGRVSAGKGVVDLISWFQKFIAENNTINFKLKLAGQVEASVVIPDHPNIEYLGFVTEAEKENLLKSCTALVNPSHHESLSMIVIEALSKGKPCLISRHCDVFRHYAKYAPTIKLFGDDTEFSNELDSILKLTPDELHRQACHSFEWAKQRFDWKNVLDSFENFIEDSE